MSPQCALGVALLAVPGETSWPSSAPTRCIVCAGARRSRSSPATAARLPPVWATLAHIAAVAGGWPVLATTPTPQREPNGRRQHPCAHAFKGDEAAAIAP